MRIRFAGFGGQGIVLCGFIIGKAAMYDGFNSIHTQAYGSASRGALTTSDVGVEKGEIHDLAFSEFDILVTLTQQSYDGFLPKLKDGGRLFYESDLVVPGDSDRVEATGLAATDLAFKEFGVKIMANIIVLGMMNEVCKVVSPAMLEKTIRETVPAGTEDKNIQAYELGIRLGKEA